MTVNSCQLVVSLAIDAPREPTTESAAVAKCYSSHVRDTIQHDRDSLHAAEGASGSGAALSLG